MLALLASLIVVAAASFDAPKAAAAPVLPAGFQDQVALSGLTVPTAMEIASDGRIFVAEKSGLVKVFDSLTDTTPTVVKDLRNVVLDFSDRGMLGLALHPSFQATPYVYVVYTYDAPIGGTAPTWNDDCPTPPGLNTDGCVASSRVTRFTVSATNVAGAEQVLINDWCQQASNHSIGHLAFGPDGSLYVGSGDGAFATGADYGQSGTPKNPCGDPPSGVGGTQTAPTAEGGALRAQDLQTPSDPTTLDGSIIRVNPDTGAAVGTVGSDTNARRIMAYGFRNPYRFTFRPHTDELWVGDVGWYRYEEINSIKISDPKTNFGWPCYEGPEPQPAYQATGLNLCSNLYANPTTVRQAHFAYKATQEVVPNDGCPTGGTALTGLAFYERGTSGNYPLEYDGALFFSDFSRRCMYAMLPGAGGVPNAANVVRFGTEIPALDLQTGPGGDLFYVDLEGGSIHRIRYFGANVPPLAVLSATPVGGPVPLTVQFDGRSSSDPDNQALTYAWDLDGDGQYDDSTSPNPSRVYTAAGSVTARLRVTDPGGLTATASRLITPGNSPPTLNVTAPVSTFTWAVGDTVSFAATAADPEQGTLPASAFRWSIVVKHCPTPGTCHTHPYQDLPGVSSGSFAAPDHEYPSHLELTVTATDSGGQSTSQTIAVQPKTATLTLKSGPLGLFCSLGPGGSNTPFTATVIQKSRNTVAAPAQVSDGLIYDFDSWSDGGAQSHETVVAAPTTLTANLSPLYVNVGDVNVNEGNAGQGTALVPIVLNKPATRTVVTDWYTQNATATSGQDYSGNNGTVTFAPGEVVKYAVVSVMGDTVAEPSEVFRITLGGETNTNTGDGIGEVTVFDNDGTPPSLVPGMATTPEGDSGTHVVNVPVLLTAPSPYTVTASWATVPGDATADDYVPVTSTVSFAPGQTSKTVPVTVRGDAENEGDESFYLWFVNPSNAALGGFFGIGAVTITDDDSIPTVDAGTATVVEGQSGTQTATVPITLSAPSADAVVLTWGTLDGSAQDGTDYHGRSGTVTFDPGETAKTVAIPVAADTVAEPTESFAISQWTTQNAIKGRTGWVTITDNDGTPPVIVPSTTLQVDEGNTGSSVASLSVALQGSSPYPVKAQWVSFGGTATPGADYVLSSGTVTFAPGQTSRTVPITILGDTIGEPNESLLVVFYNPSNASMGGFLGLGAVTIIDDD